MISLQKFDNIIFDFDGTIADTLQIHENAFKECLKHFCLDFEYSAYLGQTTEFTISQILRKNNITLSQKKLEELVILKRILANTLIKSKSKFIKGADVFLHSLFFLNKAMYIASSGSKLNVEEGLGALKIKHYFKGIVTSHDVSRSKPDPEIYNKVIYMYGLIREKSIVLEDAVSGITSGLDAGLQVICINPQIDISKFNGKMVRSYTFDQLMHFLNS